MHKVVLILGIGTAFVVSALAALWLAIEMQWDFTLTFLAALTVASAALSLALALQRSRLRRHLQRLPQCDVQALSDASEVIRFAFPTPGSRSAFLTVSVGIAAVNLPALLMLIGPICGLQLWLTVDPPHAQFAALAIGFVLAWAWWSVAVSKWRSWAESGGMTAAEVQYRGERASILCRRGHFLEKLEWKNLRIKDCNDR